MSLFFDLKRIEVEGDSEQLWEYIRMLHCFGFAILTEYSSKTGVAKLRLKGTVTK